MLPAALHGGTEPDLLAEATWRSDDFWPYTLVSAAAFIRAAASRAGVLVPQACRELSQRAGPRVP